MAATVTISAAAYFLLQSIVSIHQSRYYIPIGLAAAILFALCVDILAAVLRTAPSRGILRLSALAASGVLAAAVAAVLVLSAVNGLLHVLVFPMSAKLTVQREVERSLRANPSFRVLRFSTGDRRCWMRRSATDDAR
jgi:hypothetical protein